MGAAPAGIAVTDSETGAFRRLQRKREASASDGGCPEEGASPPKADGEAKKEKKKKKKEKKLKLSEAADDEPEPEPEVGGA